MNFNTNEKLFSFDVVESDKCAFCQTEVERSRIYSFPEKDPLIFENMPCPSLQTADAFLVVASLPSLFFGGGEATTGNASAVPRLALSWLQDDNMIVENLKKEDTIFDKFDVKEVNQSQFTTWEVSIYLLTKMSKGYALPSVIHFQD